MLLVVATATLAPDLSTLGDRDLVHALLAPGSIEPVFQPIVRLVDGEIIGYEALSRSVEGIDAGSPDQWFARAARVGLVADLDAACLSAIAKAGAPPCGRLLFVNINLTSLGQPDILELRDVLPRRVVLELSEQEATADIERLKVQLVRWTTSGVRIALDDVGAGYAGLQQIVQVRPEFLKLDRSMIGGIDEDRTRQSLVASLVGFARQTGATIVAEGIETRAELRWLRDAGVGLGQGHVLAHPSPPWVDKTALVRRSVSRTSDDGRLAVRLRDATSARRACEVVAEHLFSLGELMPSVYLEAGGRLRCQAQRGLWQVLDGMQPSAGITGRTVRTGEPQHVPDVSCAADYLEAIPGVVAEYCTPVTVDGIVIGAVNVESLVTLPEGVRGEVDRTALLLGERLAELPRESDVIPLRRLAATAASLVTVSEPGATAGAVVAALCELTGMDSGSVALDDGDGGFRVLAASGPLRDALAATSGQDLAHLSQLLVPLTSCYSSGEATGLTFVGGDALRAAGACAVVALPLAARGRRTGLLLLANSHPCALGQELIEPAELLAILAGSCLETAAQLEELHARARLDALTGLANHASFHEALRELGAGAPLGLIMFDVDGFKRINDTDGHLQGDELLRSIASAMSSTAGPGTSLYRVGGDELAAILDFNEEHLVLSEAAALAAAASAVLVPRGAGMSAGVALRTCGEPAIDALVRADDALYAAKRSGGGIGLG
jgi:diguanylate cyclase (GGDEF)-like protein